MQPNSDQNRGLQVPTSRGHIAPPSSRDAAVRLMRDQIDKIYDEPQPNEQIAASVPSVAADPTDIPDDSAYAQTHSDQEDMAAADKSKDVQQYWAKYHSAWQQYYQEYYGKYYQAQASAHEQALKRDLATKTAPAEAPQELSEDQAVDEIRSELMQKVRSRTEKIKKSRHFRPAIVALVVMLSALVLQYNQLIAANVMAFTVPSSTEKSDAYTNPTASVTIGADPRLVIPSINVDAPVDYTLNTLDEPVVQSRLKNGVVHYPIPGANAMPGEIGNTVVMGHSSNDVFDDGNYKFIFLHLDRLQKGDQFHLDRNGKRYTYLVTEKKIINPDQVSTLILNNNKPMATLITCTPVGTSQQRLLVFGEQISPNPSGASQQKADQGPADAPREIGGWTPGFFERLFQ